MTNLKWKINGQAISELYGIAKVSVINDFAAVGHAIASLEPSEASRINSVSPEPYGPIAVVGPGTGLGEAFMLWNHATCSYDVIATEGSHAPFAPKCPNHLQLLQFMWEKHQGKTCEIEHVCSGPGLRNIYEFVCVQRKTNSSDIQPSEITDRALSDSCEICSETMNLFLEILGSECANIGLRILATGGVYISGGIPPKILPLLLERSTLLESFNSNNSNMAELLARFPLFVVKNPGVGLNGAKVQAISQLNI